VVKDKNPGADWLGENSAEAASLMIMLKYATQKLITFVGIKC
jgi:hypothetical protein